MIGEARSLSRAWALFRDPVTETGQARLDACVFRLPIHGEMVPMCRVNAGGVREEFYSGIQ